MNPDVQELQEQPEPEPEPEEEEEVSLIPHSVPHILQQPIAKTTKTPTPRVQLSPPPALPPPPQPITTTSAVAIMPSIKEKLNKEDVDERFRTVSVSLQDTKEGLERIEKLMVALATPPPSPHEIHIKFELPRNPLGRYWPWIRIILMLFLVWLFFESTLCAAYCKPTYASGPSGWRPYDPLFGRAIPYKLDDWTGVKVSRAWRDYWNYWVLFQIFLPSFRWHSHKHNFRCSREQRSWRCHNWTLVPHSDGRHSYKGAFLGCWFAYRELFQHGYIRDRIFYSYGIWMA